MSMLPIKPSARPSHRRAFTLVELLVVIGIIALLMGVLLPALSSARRSAQRVRLLAGARELVAGYAAYHTDNRGSLMFGYSPPTVDGQPVLVDDEISGQTFGFPVADRYPWRLAPYVGDVWGVLHLHGGRPDRPSASDSPADAQAKAYRLSLNPTFGINSVYLGGHAGGVFQGFVGVDNRPNTGRHVAFKAGEIRRPSEQIVFAESRLRNAGPLGGPDAGGEDAGLHFVTPPRANGQRWTVNARGEFEITSGVITGLPLGRYGDGAVGFFDGHAATLSPRELEDMRLWAPRADTPDYDFN